MNPIGTVEAVFGSAHAQGDTLSRVLEPGSPIFAHDSVSTDDDASLTIRFSDSTLLTLGEEAKAGIKDFHHLPGLPEAGTMHLALGQGAFHLISGDIATQSPDGIIVETGQTSVAIHGSGGLFNIQQTLTQIGTLGYGSAHLLVLAGEQPLVMDSPSTILDIPSHGDVGTPRGYTPFESSLFMAGNTADHPGGPDADPSLAHDGTETPGHVGEEMAALFETFFSNNVDNQGLIASIFKVFSLDAHQDSPLTHGPTQLLSDPLADNDDGIFHIQTETDHGDQQQALAQDADPEPEMLLQAVSDADDSILNIEKVTEDSVSQQDTLQHSEPQQVAPLQRFYAQPEGMKSVQFSQTDETPVFQLNQSEQDTNVAESSTLLPEQYESSDQGSDTDDPALDASTQADSGSSIQSYDSSSGAVYNIWSVFNFVVLVLNSFTYALSGSDSSSGEETAVAEAGATYDDDPTLYASDSGDSTDTDLTNNGDADDDAGDGLSFNLFSFWC